MQSKFVSLAVQLASVAGPSLTPDEFSRALGQILSGDIIVDCPRTPPAVAYPEPNRDRTLRG